MWYTIGMMDQRTVDQQWNALRWRAGDIREAEYTLSYWYDTVLEFSGSGGSYPGALKARIDYDVSILRFLQVFLTFLREAS